jgi:phage N-6-adenine-methyltransferase
MNTALHFSSAKDDWRTPLDLFAELHKEFAFEVDACATEENKLLPLFYPDCFAQNWDGPAFMNPPYGRGIGKFVREAYHQSLVGCTVVCLLPARTDTAWFHDYCQRGEIRFLRGRIKFQAAKHAAPFPSMIVVFRPVRYRP